MDYKLLHDLELLRRSSTKFRGEYDIKVYDNSYVFVNAIRDLEELSY